MYKELIFVFLISFSSFAFSDISDTATTSDTAANRNFQKKLDEIDKKLTILIAEKNDNAELQFHRNSERGKGFSITIRPGSDRFASLGIETGYSFRPAKNVRYGLLFGGFLNTFIRGDSHNYVYAGLLIGSPSYHEYCEFFRILSISIL